MTTTGGDHRDDGQGSSRRSAVIIAMTSRMITTIGRDYRDGARG
jgi:hypothetical protein